MKEFEESLEESDDCCCEHHEHNHYHEDGVDNQEHMLDMFEQIEMFYSNIQDNTDVAFNVLKDLEGKEDEDVLDVVRICCNEILEVEKQAKPIYEDIKKIETIVKGDDHVDWKSKNVLLEELYDALSKCEQVSNQSYENFIIKLK